METDCGLLPLPGFIVQAFTNDDGEDRVWRRSNNVCE